MHPTPRLQRFPSLLVLLAFAFVVAVLGGCGGDGGASSASQHASNGSATTNAVSRVTNTAGKQARPSHDSGSSNRSEGSAPFRVANGDNSIPEFGVEAGAAEKSRASIGLRGYLMARAKGDWSAACSFLESPARAKLEALEKASRGRLRGCPAILGRLSGRSPAISRANPFSGKIAALRIRGGHGFALFVGSTEQQYVMPLAREGSGWKVAQLAPIPYPLGSANPPTR